MSNRTLPTKWNDHLNIGDPEVEVLIDRRRLGQTELQVDPGQVGTSNATKPDNLGVFDYAHLRVPLPKNLKGSGIFTASRAHTTPDAYFLMRRSSDGYISATGMFKVAFPWASIAEEEAEKKYIKSLPEAGREEIAGNVWIPPTSALELADEYNMRDWIVALLDPEPMAKGSADPDKDIQSPPYFEIPGENKRANTSEEPSATNGASLPPPEPEKMSTRKRNLRSASPSKAPATPSRKIATPRRGRRARPAASSTLPETQEEPEEIQGQTVNGDRVTVDVNSTTAPGANGDEEVTTTHVTVETPADHPRLAHKHSGDAQAILDQAKAAIDEANHLTAGRAAGRKRKAAEISMDPEDEAADPVTRQELATDHLPAPKRVRYTEQELRKEKIKRRATVGIAASLAIGAMLPVVMSTFFNAL